MLVSADSVVALDGAAGAVSAVIVIAEATSLPAVFLSNVAVPAVILDAVDGLVHTGGVRSRVGSIIVTGDVGGGGIRGGTVGGSGVGESGVAGVVEESTVSPVPGELDEAAVSPGASPGVLDEDVVGGVSDGGDGVVRSAGTGGVPDDSSLVLLEVVGHLEGNGKRAGSESLDVGSLRSCNRGVSGDLGSDHVVGAGGRFARSVLVDVAVVGSGSQTSSVLLGVVVAVRRPSSLATISGGVDTVQPFLLGEVPQLSSDLLVPGLKTSNSSECPARSTASLVLDGGDGSFLDPELLSGRLESSADGVDSVGEMSGDVESKVLALLSLSHGGEEVDTVISGVLEDRVGSGDEFSVLSEDAEPHPVLGVEVLEVLLGLEVCIELEGCFGRLEDLGEDIVVGKADSHQAEYDKDLHVELEWRKSRAFYLEYFPTGGRLSLEVWRNTLSSNHKLRRLNN